MGPTKGAKEFNGSMDPGIQTRGINVKNLDPEPWPLNREPYFRQTYSVSPPEAASRATLATPSTAFSK